MICFVFLAFLVSKFISDITKICKSEEQTGYFYLNGLFCEEQGYNIWKYILHMPYWYPS